MKTKEKNTSAKEVLLFSIGSVLLLGSTFFVGRKLIRDAVKKNEEGKSAEDGSTASYAKAIKMAFDNDGWWGTDEAALRNTLISIPTKAAFNSVLHSYQKLYNRSLMADMQSELDSSEYNEMLSIINGKKDNTKAAAPLEGKRYETWARRLKAAFDKSYGFIPGTDEEAIRAVFIEIPSQTAFGILTQTYQQLYSKNLITELKSELEFWEYEPMMKLINTKPK